MSPNIEPALLFVHYACLFVGSLLGVTTAGIGLLGPSFIDSIAGTHSVTELSSPSAFSSSDC